MKVKLGQLNHNEFGLDKLNYLKIVDVNCFYLGVCLGWDVGGAEVCGQLQGRRHQTYQEGV